MGREITQKLDHDQVRDALETALADFIERQLQPDHNPSFDKEVPIDIPYSVSERRPDVLLEFDEDAIPERDRDYPLHGCAFEVKTTISRTQRDLGQIYHYDKAGYQPILVAPGRVLTEERGGTVPSYEWVLQFVDNGCALEIVSAEPLRLTASDVTCGQLPIPGLQEFLVENSLS